MCIAEFVINSLHLIPYSIVRSMLVIIIISSDFMATQSSVSTDSIATQTTVSNMCASVNGKYKMLII